MKNIVLAGFHAVGARLRMDPKSISAVYLDPERRDKRMREMREKLIAAGVRVMTADNRRLDGMAPDVPHQGIVAMAEEKQAQLEFDELLDLITDDTLILILDGVTDPRNFGACLRVADAAGVQCVLDLRIRPEEGVRLGARRRGRRPAPADPPPLRRPCRHSDGRRRREPERVRRLGYLPL